jgi:hypothetical protein
MTNETDGTRWLQTVNARAYDLDRDPDPESIDIRDIAYALAHLNRYNGHAGGYSVAQHSVLALTAAERMGLQRVTCASALMHDAHEAYVGDVPSPIKRVLGPTWRAFERQHEIAVRRRFRLPIDLAPIVKSIDLRMLVTERRDLFSGREVRPWGIDAEPFEDLRITRWSPEISRRMFLAACEAYGIE